MTDRLEDTLMPEPPARVSPRQGQPWSEACR